MSSHCCHVFRTHGPAPFACKACGMLYASSGVLRTSRQDSMMHASPLRLIKSLRMTAAKPVTHCSPLDGSLIAMLNDICAKFEFTSETLALGLHYYAMLTQTSRPEGYSDRFWAASCLLVAAKAIELDRKVPYLNRYQRHVDKTYPKEAYEKAEREIVHKLDYKLQYSTFFSFLNFYLTIGVIYESDGLPQQEVCKVQEDISIQAKDYLSRCLFFKFQPETLAISMIRDARIKHGLHGWPRQLCYLSNLKMSDKLGQARSEANTPPSLSPRLTLPVVMDSKIMALRKRKRDLFSSVNSNSAKQNGTRPDPQQNLVHLKVSSKILSTEYNKSSSVMKITAQMVPTNPSLRNILNIMPKR